MTAALCAAAQKLARERGISFHAAAAELGRRGVQSRREARVMRQAFQDKAFERRIEREERMGFR